MWDRFCRIYEKNLPLKKIPTVRRAAEEARLFMFDKPAHDFLPRDVSSELGAVMDDFRLPFPVMAIQDPAGLVIIMDKEPDQVGFTTERDYIEINFLDTDLGAFDGRMAEPDDQWKLAEIKQQLPDARLGAMTAGTLSWLEDMSNGNQLAYAVNLRAFCLLDGDKIVDILRGRDVAKKNEDVSALCRNYAVALQEAAYLLLPSNFVLETTPKRVRKPGKKIPRKHERPTYTILQPNKIRATMGLENPGNSNGKAKTPHERRGHYRTLRSGYYKKRQGNRIWVNPTWIGPSEAKVGTRTYKVRLDL